MVGNLKVVGGKQLGAQSSPRLVFKKDIESYKEDEGWRL